MSGSKKKSSDASAGREALKEILGSRYEVVDKLGAGAFGEVYRARDTTLAREVAIKRIRLDAFAESDQLEEVKARFVREAQVAAQLRHPNIITTHDIVSGPTMSFIVMELVEGQTLQALLKSKGRLSVTETLQHFQQAAGALDHAHAQGVIHRDVKPANIMIEPSGNLKVMDFGIAKAGTSENITASGAILGTPNYMSPEQARGESLDGRSDLFSLGCILYECLTGVKPFSGENVTAVLMKILTADPPAVDLEQTGLPAAVNDVLRVALAKDRQGRYATGAALVDSLRGVAYGTGAVSAAVPPPPAMSAPATGAGSPGLGSAGAPVTGATLGTIPSLAPPPTPLTAAATPSWRRPALAAAAVLILLAGFALAQSSASWKPLAFATGTEQVAPEGDPSAAPVVEVQEIGFVGRMMGRQPLMRITVPADAPLSLELDAELSSNVAQPGDSFTAHTTAPLAIEGHEAIPTGTIVVGHVAHAKPAGKVKGTGQLTLEFDTLQLGERQVPISVAPINREAKASTRRNAATIGGGAGAGAIVGGLFGGKKGALIGGAIGGAAGGAKVVTTRGKDVTLAQGTSLEIRLQESIVVTREHQPAEQP